MIESRKLLSALISIIIIPVLSTALPTPSPTTPSSGNSITVNSMADVANANDGLCTLREAITAANSNTASGSAVGECAAGINTGSDAIIFSVTGTINLSSALPDVSSDLTITGPGSSQLTVRRNSGTFRIFNITSGTVALSGVTVTNGRPPDGDATISGGGGIQNLGTLTLTDVAVTSNQSGVNTSGVGSAGGGGIFNKGTLTASNCSVTDNSTANGFPNGSPHGGAGIGNAGTLAMTNCLIDNNRIGNNGGLGNGAAGGGIFSIGPMTLVGTIISNNVAGDGGDVGGGGGGITNAAPSTFINCIVSHNRTGHGSLVNGPAGGIFNGSNLTIIGSAIYGNQDNGVASGIENFHVLIIINTTVSDHPSVVGINNVTSDSIMSLTNCTVTANGTGIINSGSTSPASTARNSIIAGNATDISGNFSSLGHNLLGKTNSGFFPQQGFVNGVNGDQVGTEASPINPQLAPLANNGGLTMTHALLSNSPALDAGDNCVSQAAHCDDANLPQLLTDQRGLGRLLDGPDADSTATVDIGAYETQPTLAKIPDATISEDGQILVGFDAGDATAITSVAASNGTLVPNDAAHLSATLSGSTGVITINPIANQNGTTNIVVGVSRPGGSDSKTFQLTVTPVNDVPSFTKGPDQTVNEDAGAQTIANWATNVSAGPNEGGQNLTFQVTNNTNTALFAAGPAISSTGTLTYTTTANANGAATITFNLKDDGGTANGGVDTTATQTFTITVNSVNDTPSFTKGGDQTVNNNAGAQTLTNWATNISAGPSNESAQLVTFQVTSNSNSGLFTSAPAISSAGTLTYTPAPSAGGTATITINLKDNGGTANGGVDTSVAQTFTITVTPVGGFVNFQSSTANTTENSGSTTVNVVRTGDTSKAVAVNYGTNADSGVPCSTANGVASPKCDFTAALGTLNFAVGETSKSITILLSQDSFVEGPETMTVTLSNPTNNAALGVTPAETVTIADDATEPPTNIIDDAGMFVRMHYHDFLNREADQSGLDFWTGQMSNCGSPDLLVCRVNVSGAFFLSIEFQQTGYLVERIYKTGYGDATGTSTIGGSHQIFVPVVRADEFLADTQRIGRGVIVLSPGWEQALENNKQAYALEFVQASRFITAFPTTMTPAQFVDKLNTNAGGVLSLNERQTAINLFNNSVNATNVAARAQALRQIAEDQDLYNFEFNKAFVLTEFIGYLRRNPNDAPDSDYTGYDFWLTKLNQANGDYIKAEMVKAFISSDEYRRRFGP